MITNTTDSLQFSLLGARRQLRSRVYVSNNSRKVQGGISHTLFHALNNLHKMSALNTVQGTKRFSG